MQKIGAALGFGAALTAGCSGSVESGPSIPLHSPSVIVPTQGPQVPVWSVEGDLAIFVNPQRAGTIDKLKEGEPADATCISTIPGYDEQETRNQSLVRIERQGVALGYISIQGRSGSDEHQPVHNFLQIDYDALRANLPDCGTIRA